MPQEIKKGFNGYVRVEAAGNVGLTFKPINDWRVDWIAE